MPHGLRNARLSLSADGVRSFALAASLVCGAILPSGSAFGMSSSNKGDSLSVDHDGIYLAQQIGKCLNGSGACYFGGQCPGGEYTGNRYANGRVYCSTFRPPAPYPPSVFQRLLGVE
jgi:hypothetical protein